MTLLYTILSRCPFHQGRYNGGLAENGTPRILLVDWSMIGDLVMLSPAVQAIRATLPEAYLAILGQPRSLEIYKQHPRVDALLPYDRKRGDWNLGAFFAAVKLIRQGKFDKAYLFHNSIGSALMASLGGVKERIGYSTEARGFLLTKALHLPGEREHLIETRLRLLRADGFAVEDLKEEIFIDADAAKPWLKDKLGPNFGRSRPIVSISLGATMPYKQWSGEQLNRFLAMLPVNSCDIVFVGSPDERSLFEGVYSYNNTVVDLVGSTTIEELSWVLDRADLHLGPDSGPMHLALGRDTAVVALFGATDPARCGPYNATKAKVVRSHRCCRDCERRFGRNISACTHTIEADSVYQAAVELLSNFAPLWPQT